MNQFWNRKEPKLSSRRQFLKILGSSAVVLAAAGPGGAGCAATRPSRATSPWRRAGGASYADPRKRALSWAILAPNPHNRQPWLIGLDRPDEIVLYCDRERLLSETDPFERQIVIGLGAFLEILRMAAAADGWLTTIEPFPEGEASPHLDGRPIARIRFASSGLDLADPLFRSVSERRSLKEPYDTTRPVSEETLSAISEAVGNDVVVGHTNDPEERTFLRELTRRAYLVEVTTDRTNRESVRLMRIGHREIERHPDGIALSGFGIELASMLGLVTRDRLADRNSTAFEQGVERVLGQLRTAMAHFWISTPDDTRRSQLMAGAAWVRANLKATELGIGIHPLSQSLQEYPEMRPLYEEIHERLVGSGRRIQMFARVGYGPRVAPTPRWPLESRILTP